MDEHADMYERSMAFAEIALGQIKALRQPATPRVYEIWYAYATGYHQSLNEAINKHLTARGKISVGELDKIYDTFLSSNRVADQIDSVGSRVVTEIDHVMSTIDSAVGSATTYSDNLATMTERLGRANDRTGIRMIIEGLVQTTQEMERSNQTLEDRLKAFKIEINELQENLEAVRAESLTDPLTSLANRKYFGEALTRAIAEAEKTRAPLSLMFTDIDHFKSFNDSHGHLTGDQVLRLVALEVRQAIEDPGVAARYGGEEFAIILPDTMLSQAQSVAEAIRRAVMAKELVKRSTGAQLGRVTMSIGVATLRPQESMQALIERADACLYAAKRNGRNCVVAENELGTGVPKKQVSVA
jgi:diguanylate cyclase